MDCLKERPEWASTLNNITSQCNNKNLRLVVCGGKNVGKSSFLKLVSKRLKDNAAYIDLDPGQSEFTPPGFISVVIGGNAVGPNWTHLKKAQRMFFVGIDVGACPQHYMKCLLELVNFCNQQPTIRDMPWIVNTMGFNKGLGVDIMVCIIRSICPSDVIELHSGVHRENYPFLMTSSDVTKYSSCLWRESQRKSKGTEYNYHNIDPVGEALRRGNMKPSKLREFVVMSYFNTIEPSPLAAKPYIIPLRNICIHFLNETAPPSCVLVVLNAKIVALSKVKLENETFMESPGMPKIILTTPVAKSMGLGLIRGVDPHGQMLYVITPISHQELKNVNCLIVGNIETPTEFFQRQSTPYCQVDKSGNKGLNTPVRTKGPSQAFNTQRNAAAQRKKSNNSRPKNRGNAT